MKNIFSTWLMCLAFASFAQNKPNTTPPTTPSKPKLVVGMVVDQMRWDYLYRYAAKYGNGGFKRLQTGYNCENTHIPYIPTYTAPGHACIYTGTVPAINGIVGNDWYSRYARRRIYCAEDTSCRTVGTTGDAGQMSPRRMLTTTVTDELRMASNFKSKVIGIAIKDRGAILPAGHTANGAYWFDGKSGNWISSSYYADTLPRWADEFNAKKLPATYLAQNWKPLLDMKEYVESTKDNEPYEKSLRKEGKAVFPYNTSEMMEKNVDIIKSTPYGNTLTFDFAKAAMEGEKLGKGSATDFLAISFSSTDYIGHQFGPNSIEVEDCYIRFDRDLADFLNYLDKSIGAGNYLVFLTADHGAANSAGFSEEHKIPSGSMDDDIFVKMNNHALKRDTGVDSIVEAFDNMQLYLGGGLGPDGMPIDMAFVRRMLVMTHASDTYQNVKMAIDLKAIDAEPLPASIRERIINGYYPDRSGDIQIIYQPAVLEDRPKGTTHGSMYNYDTHIPLLWYGWGVKSGCDYSPTSMTDIAATVAALLHIQEPNGCVGKPILLMK